MRNALIALALLAVSTSNAQIHGQIALETFPVHGADVTTPIAAEYMAQIGRVNLFGFVETWRTEGEWKCVSPHQASIGHMKYPIALVVRGGYDPFVTGLFTQVGSEVAISRLPKVGKVVQKVAPYLAVGHLHSLSDNLLYKDELTIVGSSPSVRTPLGDVTFSGFHRFRLSSDAPHFGQYQLMVNVKGVLVGTELEVVNKNVTRRFGARYVKRF